MKELVEYVVKSLVDNPDEVSVYEIQGHSGTVLELSVAGSDMGRVIGKSGRVINAIRSLLQVAAAKQGDRVSLELLESDDR
ncbi:MAG: KH domain-containing protein [Chloroflexi bacterium]|nr:KH domain-containing protein [Chloroflexota bacterium]